MITFEINDSQITLPASVHNSSGRSASAETGISAPGQNLQVRGARTVGREQATRAQASKSIFVLTLLQAEPSKLHEITSPWYRNLLATNSAETITWPTHFSEPTTHSYSVKDCNYRVPKDKAERELNASQKKAVNAMMDTSEAARITIVQGPPGTGKTSVIARFVRTFLQEGHRGLWLIAQSNVAVKNIAEKLLAVNFPDWKLLVSKDFHMDW